jgi:TolB-like protein/Tfp pilus assembly protein PilF
MAPDRPDTPLLASTWAELRRRKVVRAAIAYAAIAWIVLQLGEITFEPLGLPPWALTWTILVAILGFPVVLVLAWLFDRRNDGLARDSAGAGFSGPARLFAVILVVVTVGAVAWWLTDVYRADGATTDATPARVQAAPAESTAPPNSIAVLPFDDMSPDGDQAWFADGIAEELLDQLARVEGLRVAARTSSFALRDNAQDVVSIGKALNVRTVLEGSVRKADGKIRVTAQLIDAGNGFHLWSDTYERSDQGIFALQDEITRAIVEQLRQRIPGLTVPAGDALAQATTGSADTADVKAHELYLQGRTNWRQRTPSSLARARELFEQAIERDPDYARAWSGLADTDLLLADYGTLSSAEAVELAEPAVVKALTLAPGLGEAWASLGLLRLTAGQFDAAEGNLLEAIRLDPNYDMAAMWLGGLYGRQGKLKAREDILNRARDLSPLDPAIAVNLANTRLAQGDVAGARKALLSLLEITPDNTMARRSLAQLERISGNLAEGLRESDATLRLDPDDPYSIAELGAALAALGRFDEAERVLRRIPHAVPVRPFLLYLLAVQQDRAAPTPIELRTVVDRLVEDSEPLPEEMRPVVQIVALSAYWSGDGERALSYLLRLLAGRDEALLPEDLGYASQAMFALRETGREDEAMEWRRRVEQRYRQFVEQGIGGASTDYEVAALKAFDGDTDGAIAGIADAVRGGFSELWLLDSDPRWNGLRDVPAFAQVRAELARRVERERQASMAFATY